jgi:hypothetical protein
MTDRAWTIALVLAACHGAPAAVAWQPPVELARGGGEKGPWQQNESRFDYVDDPSAAITADGATAVVWVDQARMEVLFQVIEPDDRARFAQPIDVSRSPGVFSWLPRVAVSAQRPDDVYVLWQEIVFSGGPHGGDIFFTRSRDGGATFEPPRNLTRTTYGEGKGRLAYDRWDNGSIDLVVSDRGDIYAAWTAWDGPLWLTRSVDGGATFTTPHVIERGEEAPARAPAIAAAGDRVWVAWTTGEHASADIRVAASADGGATFAPPRIVERTPAFSDAPDLAIDGAGTLHLVFGDAMHVRYTRSIDGGATFAPSRVISAKQQAGFPTLAVDRGRVDVLWELYAADHAPHGLGFTRSEDGGATFARPVEVPGTRDAGPNGSQQGRLTHKLAVRDHAIIIVNSALRRGEGSRVWLVRGTASS